MPVKATITTTTKETGKKNFVDSDCPLNRKKPFFFLETKRCHKFFKQFQLLNEEKEEEELTRRRRLN